MKNAAWAKSPIDRFIPAKLEAEGLQPAEPAEPRTLIRRLTFDLTGLLADVEEVMFLADKSPDALCKLVDRLLSSAALRGERWGRYWARRGPLCRGPSPHSSGVKPNRPPKLYRYRDWVIAAFNSDMPYDRFVKMQIAADAVVDMPDEDRLKQRRPSAFSAWALNITRTAMPPKPPPMSSTIASTP